MANILVVDDDPFMRDSLLDILDSHGHVGTGFSSAVDALEALSDQAFDLAITDLKMPVMDGIEFLIRVQEAFPDVRMIAMSGGGFQPKENVLGAASTLGAITVLEKPFSVEDVLAAVDVALESDDDAHEAR